MGRCRRRKDWRPSVSILCKLLCKSLTPPTPHPRTPLPQGQRGESTCPARQRLLQQKPLEPLPACTHLGRRPVLGEQGVLVRLENSARVWRLLFGACRCGISPPLRGGVLAV